MKNVIKILTFCFLVAVAFVSKGQDVIVIVNNDNPVESLKQIEAKLYYLRKLKQTWPGTGDNIKPVERSGDSPAKTAFLTSILKMSESEVDAYFKQRQFANAEQVPPSFSNDEAIIKYVSETKGAIGYVSPAAFNAAGGKVKSVLTQ